MAESEGHKNYLIFSTKTGLTNPKKIVNLHTRH